MYKVLWDGPFGSLVYSSPVGSDHRSEATPPPPAPPSTIMGRYVHTDKQTRTLLGGGGGTTRRVETAKLGPEFLAFLSSPDKVTNRCVCFCVSVCVYVCVCVCCVNKPVNYIKLLIQAQ